MALRLGVDIKTLRRMMERIQKTPDFWEKLPATFDHLEWHAERKPFGLLMGNLTTFRTAFHEKRN